ncbi:hypothetical protein [Agrobacterium vitis]|uniref:hypothetical protein n=1 Tax=Agrobacterium vitis TaxID=373 RepID=UPI0012E752CC|nr:hypothetical protein [Agrobacterium vitis]MVA64300.1 hypothetical protein [Agrobacterium vitis]
MTQNPRPSKTMVSQSERKELLAGMVADVPELRFTPQDDPDPRLVQLARLLGRQMARQNFDAQTKKRV